MTGDDFNTLLERRLTRTRETLATKAGEYAMDTDRLHNFKRAAEMRGKGETPREALLGMLIKHLVSVFDMVDGDREYPEGVWDEKVGDSINYFILLEAIVAEARPKAALVGVLGGALDSTPVVAPYAFTPQKWATPVASVFDIPDTQPWATDADPYGTRDFSALMTCPHCFQSQPSSTHRCYGAP